jgi:hypothetical protein
MLLFRSEEDVGSWCASRGCRPGALVPIRVLHRLARAWYGDRLDPAWRPRTRAQLQAVLEGVGLSGRFWRLD